MGRAELKLDVDADLLDRAREAGLDLTGLTEAALREALERIATQTLAQRWADENAGVLQRHRQRIEHDGVFGDDLRTW